MHFVVLVSERLAVHGAVCLVLPPAVAAEYLVRETCLVIQPSGSLVARTGL